MSYYSKDVYVDVGAGVVAFAVTFPFLSRTHVFVSVIPNGGVETSVLEGWSWVSDSQIVFDTAPVTLYGANVDVIVKRETPADALLERFTSPSTIVSGELNFILLQLLYLIEEAIDAGQSAIAEDLLALLSALVEELRWSYDVTINGANSFFNNERIGPCPITTDCYLPHDAPGSQFTVPVEGKPTVLNHIVSIRKHSAGVSVDEEIGRITVTVNTQTATVAVNVDVTFAPGDALSLVTVQDGGMLNFGATLRLSRIDT
jgi:hypothetical protein